MEKNNQEVKKSGGLKLGLILILISMGSGYGLCYNQYAMPIQEYNLQLAYQKSKLHEHYAKQAEVIRNSISDTAEVQAVREIEKMQLAKLDENLDCKSNPNDPHCVAGRKAGMETKRGVN